jgi:glycerol-3-phosphate acyltransferase PlsY
MTWALAAIVSFLIGSIPSGLWIGRAVRRIDVREHGSGNLGATNVYRTLGPVWGVTVLLLDAAKGVAAVLLAREIVATYGGQAQIAVTSAARAAQSATTALAAATNTASALFAMAADTASAALAAGDAESSALLLAGIVGMVASALGHMFTPFAGFRGGKGVATLAGAWATLAPIVFVIALASWIVTFALRRVVSLASMVSALVLPLAAALLLGVSDPRFFIAIVVAALLILRHRSNLTRLRKGEERRLDLRGPRSSL